MGRNRKWIKMMKSNEEGGFLVGELLRGFLCLGNYVWQYEYECFSSQEVWLLQTEITGEKNIGLLQILYFSIDLFTVFLRAVFQIM